MIQQRWHPVLKTCRSNRLLRWHLCEIVGKNDMHVIIIWLNIIDYWSSFSHKHCHLLVDVCGYPPKPMLDHHFLFQNSHKSGYLPVLDKPYLYFRKGPIVDCWECLSQTSLFAHLETNSHWIFTRTTWMLQHDTTIASHTHVCQCPDIQTNPRDTNINQSDN